MTTRSSTIQQDHQQREDHMESTYNVLVLIHIFGSLFKELSLGTRLHTCVMVGNALTRKDVQSPGEGRGSASI